MTDLEKARQDLAKAKDELEIAKHQLTRDKNRLTNALKKQDKARTHRLIQEGAELEYIFDGIETIPTETFWNFMHELIKIPGVMELFQEKKTENSTPSVTEGGDT